MDRDSKGGSGDGASIAGETLRPRQSPMSTLFAGNHGPIGLCSPIERWRRPQRHSHCFGSHHTQPVPPDVTTGPIAPQHWRKCGWFRRCENRCIPSHLVGRDRPENGTDSPGFDREKIFLTLRPQKAVATITNASGIQHAQRPIALRSAFLWVERMIGRAEQASIRLRCKS